MYLVPVCRTGKYRYRHGTGTAWRREHRLKVRYRYTILLSRYMRGTGNIARETESYSKTCSLTSTVAGKCVPRYTRGTVPEGTGTVQVHKLGSRNPRIQVQVQTLKPVPYRTVWSAALSPMRLNHRAKAPPVRCYTFTVTFTQLHFAHYFHRCKHVTYFITIASSRQHYKSKQWRGISPTPKLYLHGMFHATTLCV